MSLLIEATLGGTLHRISNRYTSLEHRWLPLVHSVASIKFQTPAVYGGYAVPTFSDISFLPSLFDDNWPPPASFPIKIMDTNSTEANAVTLFDGVARLGSVDRFPIQYTLASQTEDIDISQSTSLTGTLESVVTWFCDASRLNLSTDYTRARTTSPAVSHTTASEQKAITLLSDICKFFSHGFKIIDGTLYLVDMLDVAAPTAISQYTSLVIPSSYEGGEAVSEAVCGNYSVDGSDSTGSTITVSTAYHTAQANIETALTDIITISERPRCVLNLHMGKTAPVLFDCIEYDYARLRGATTYTGIVSEAIYNYDSRKIRLYGPGVIA